MMLGARTAAWAKSGYTAHDYVQDGLIAMWDGIENAGWGQHDPSATVWKDLVGGFDITLEDGCYVWRGDQIESTIGTAGQYAGVVSIPRLGYGNGAFHIESANVPVNVSTMTTYTNGIGGTDEFWSTGTACEYTYNPNGTKMTTNVGCQWQNSWGRSIKFKISITETVVDSLSFKNPGEPSAFGRNGVVTTPAIDGYVGQTYTGNPGGMMRVLKSTYSRYGLKCLRVYGRQLSGEEIAANYAIDKARFNLP